MSRKKKFIVYCKQWTGLHAFNSSGQEQFHLFLTMRELVKTFAKIEPGECGVGSGFPVNGNEVVLLEDESLYKQVQDKHLSIRHEDLVKKVWDARRTGRVVNAPLPFGHVRVVRMTPRVWDFTDAIKVLLGHLNEKDGHDWFKALKEFNKKKNPWPVTIENIPIIQTTLPKRIQTYLTERAWSMRYCKTVGDIKKLDETHGLDFNIEFTLEDLGIVREFMKAIGLPLREPIDFSGCPD
jgi:hypothetical protein